MERFVIKLAYNGTNYHGWQIQENAHTIQAELTEKISLLLRQDIELTGCGRTDTGVHANDFYVHFDAAIGSSSPTDLVYKLNSFLPSDIVIFHIKRISTSFNVRFSAISRTYKYYISRTKNPFKEKTSYYLNIPLDVDAMNSACKYLTKYEDFTSFSKLHTQTATNNCNITFAGFKEANGELVFTITADRFLRNMVRAIVGTLLEIGKGKMNISHMQRVIEARDRGKAGFSVPAQGLFLHSVEYPEEFDL